MPSIGRMVPKMSLMMNQEHERAQQNPAAAPYFILEN